MYRVALVCEGPADRVILESILDHYLDDYEPIPIQPPIGVLGGDAGPFGGGWKGVRNWCCQENPLSVLRNADILIVQVDADVALDPLIDCCQPCPPPIDTVNEVRTRVAQWFGGRTPPEVLFCIPSMATETWAFVALFPNHGAVVPCIPPPFNAVCVECRTDIKSILWQERIAFGMKLVESKNGRLKNSVAGYRNVQDRIADGWPTVLSVCGVAMHFDNELRAVLR